MLYYYVTDDLMVSRNKGFMLVIALLDFSKAFDAIDHRIMISILIYRPV